MTTGQTIALVVFILAIDAGVLFLAFAWARKRAERVTEEMMDELGGRGERLVLGPDEAMYRGGSKGFPGIRGNGVMALTNQRFLFRQLTGARIEIPIADIESVSEAKWFMRAYWGGRLHLILNLRDERKVGFTVKDHQRWMDDVSEAVRRA